MAHPVSTIAVPVRPSLGRGRWSSGGRWCPDINSAALANFLPIILYVGVHEAAGNQAAIAAALVALLLVFRLSRERGALRILAVLSVGVAVVAGTIGMALRSDTAFLIRDPVGDFLAVAVLVGSVSLGRPIAGRKLRGLTPAPIRTS